MHLSYEDLALQNYMGNYMSRFQLSDKELSSISLDDRFFYSVPTSFFVLDQRIPKILR